MRYYLSKIFFLVIFLLAACSKNTSHMGTTSSSGGGNGCASEFFAKSGEVIALINQQDGITWNGRKIDNSVLRLEETVSQMKVRCVRKHLKLKGAPKAAINTPIKMSVVVSELDWQTMDKPGKLLLVLHELIALTFSEMEIDDRTPDFIASRSILKQDARDALSSEELDSISELARKAAISFANENKDVIAFYDEGVQMVQSFDLANGLNAVVRVFVEVESPYPGIYTYDVTIDLNRRIKKIELISDKN